MSRLSIELRSLRRQVNILSETTDDLNRRLFNVMRPARVSQVDPEKGLIKAVYAKDADGQDVETCWIPWTTRAGKIKEWSPPSVGEQIMLCSPSGNIGTGSWGGAGGFSNQNPQNHDKDGEWKLSVGNSSIHMKDGQIITRTPHKKNEAGKIEYEQDKDWTQPVPGRPEPGPASDIPMS